MNTIGSAYPAQVLVAQAEIRLVADQTENAKPVTIKADERAVTDAQEVAKLNARVDLIT